MQSSRSYNNDFLNEEKTDPKIDSNVTYNYKRRRKELNQIVKHQVEKQKQNLTQNKNSVSV